MTDLSHIADDLADELVSQPELFPVERVLDHQGQVVVRARGAYTGQRITTDEHKVKAACGLRLLGLSDRAIAAKLECARESIHRLLEEGERRGYIKPIYDRLKAKMGYLAEESVDLALALVADIRAGERTEGNTMALKAIAPLVGICTDKVLLFQGSATSIVEQRTGPTRDEWLREYGRHLITVTAEPVAAQLLNQGAATAGSEVTNELAVGALVPETTTARDEGLS